MIKKFFLNALSKALNKTLELDPEMFTRLKNLADKTIEIDLTNLDKKVFLLLTQTGFQVVEQTDHIPDIVMRGTTLGFMKLRAQKHVSLYNSEVKIMGDMGLAEEMKKIFSQLDLDWEAGLAEYTGDVAAHHLGKVIKGSLSWLKQTHDNLQETSKDYFQEEVKVLPTRDEMQRFASNVTRLRDDVERLVARFEKLTHD